VDARKAEEEGEEDQGRTEDGEDDEGASPATPTGEKWIDVDLSAKTVTAYVGDTPVWGPRSVVDGKPGNETATGTFEIYLRYEQQDMTNAAYYPEDHPSTTTPRTSPGCSTSTADTPSTERRGVPPSGTPARTAASTCRSPMRSGCTTGRASAPRPSCTTERRSPASLLRALREGPSRRLSGGALSMSAAPYLSNGRRPAPPAGGARRRPPVPRSRSAARRRRARRPVDPLRRPHAPGAARARRVPRPPSGSGARARGPRTAPRRRAGSGARGRRSCPGRAAAARPRPPHRAPARADRPRPRTVPRRCAAAR